MKRRFFDPEYRGGRVRASTRKGMVVTTVALEPDQHERLTAIAQKHGTVLTALIRQAVEDWLDHYDKRQKGGKRK
jgi:predicted transcriptional regulator